MKADINGITTAYSDRGNGLPLVLIHGFPLCRKMWRPQAEALAKAGCRVITPDLRGFGESGLTPVTANMDNYSDDIVALMDHLGIDLFGNQDWLRNLAAVPDAGHSLHRGQHGDVVRFEGQKSCLAVTGADS